MYDLCNAMWVKRFYFCNCLKWIHAGYLSSIVQLYNFKYNFKINQLTPVQAVTGRDEHLPLFHFCKHHLWPNLASFTLAKFFRRKRSLQWYPDHSDWVNGAWNSMKMLRNLSEYMRAKRPSGTLRYSIVRIACLYDALSGFSSTGSRPCRRSVKKDK